MSVLRSIPTPIETPRCDFAAGIHLQVRIMVLLACTSVNLRCCFKVITVIRCRFCTLMCQRAWSSLVRQMGAQLRAVLFTCRCMSVRVLDELRPVSVLTQQQSRECWLLCVSAASARCACKPANLQVKMVVTAKQNQVLCVVKGRARGSTASSTV